MGAIYGNHTNYGEAVGILMLEPSFPRIPGDIGNATTFPFPVRYQIVKGANPGNVVEGADPEIILRFAEGARELERQGVRAIVTSCGFTALFHRTLADAVDVPVFSSSLIQMGLVHAMLKKDQRVGVITAKAGSLTPQHFEGVGAGDVPRAVIGMEGTSFASLVMEQAQSIDLEKVTGEMRARARQLVSEHPDVGAIVLECTNMPPFAKAVQEETGLPVFDIVTLTRYVFSAVVRTEFRGYL